MSIVFICWFVLIWIAQIVYLVKSVKTKDNKSWIVLFSSIAASAISIVVLWAYTFGNMQNIGWMSFVYIALCILAGVVYLVMLLTAGIIKIIQVIKSRKYNIHIEKLEKKVILKSVLIPLAIIVLISIVGCVADYSIYKFKDIKELVNYNNTKDAEIKKMASFISQKYETDFTVDDCIYYREEDYSRHEDIFGNGKDYNIPYIAVFEKNGQWITVADRKGTLSDNGQLEEIGLLIGDYFGEITGTDIEYVQIRRTYSGGVSDDTINKVLQYSFGEKLTGDNIKSFMDKVLAEDDLELKFFVKDIDDRSQLISQVTTKLSYLSEYENIEYVEIYVYDKDEDLVVKRIEKEFGERYSESDDYSDDYKFGYCFVPTSDSDYYPSETDRRLNTFVAGACFDLNRGYTPSKGNGVYEIVNNWYIYDYDSLN